MNKLKMMLGVAAAAVACAGGVAHAARVGVFIGGGAVYNPYPYYAPVAPAYYPGYYDNGYPDYWDYPYPVYHTQSVYPVPVPVPVYPAYQGDNTQYIERGSSGSNVAPPPAPAQAPQGNGNGSTWYYCAQSQTYYPYVKQCASGWRQVPARPQ